MQNTSLSPKKVFRKKSKKKKPFSIRGLMSVIMCELTENTKQAAMKQ